MKRFAISDIHGMYDRMISVLEKAKFNPEEDKLYLLGDLCDRGRKCHEVVDYLMTLPNVDGVFGNHDVWLYDWLNACIGNTTMDMDAYDCWKMNGGRYTLESFEEDGYLFDSDDKLDVDKAKRIVDFLGKLKYRIELDDCILVHNAVAESQLMYKELKKPLNEITLASSDEDGLLRFDGWNYDRVYDEDVFSRKLYKMSTAEQKGLWEEFGYDVELRNMGYKPGKLTICGHTPLEQVEVSQKLNVIYMDGGAFIGPKGQSKDYYMCAHECDWKVPTGCINMIDLDTMEIISSRD